MRGHAGYVRVDENGELVPVQEAIKELPMIASAPVKRMGRPRKAVTI
jgi:ribosomal protein S26